MKLTHAEGSGSILQSRFARVVVPLVAALFACATSQAELLLYDGFATATDGQNRAAYQTSEERMSLQGDNAKSTAYTTGLSSDKPWSETSTVVYTFKNKGLSLPTAFTDGTGDQFTARGGGAGYMNSDSGSDKRAKNRALAYTMPTSGTLYYRCLMKVDSEAYSTLQTGSDWYYQGTGLSTVSAVNKYDNANDLKNNGFRLGFTGRSGVSPKRVDLGINLGGQYYTVLEGISAGTTYIAIVELNYNTAKARVYATPIADYSKTFSWTVENLDIASAVSGSAMKVMFLDGHYKTGGGYVVFDEIAAGTILSDVAVVAPVTAPQLGAVSLTRSGAATYAVSAEVLENVADTVSWIAADGTAATTNAFATAVATNTTASGSVSGLAPDKTYQVSVLAESAGGSDEKVSGTIYTGALSLGATTDAYEYGSVTGGVVVARASADPFPLTVNYTISGSAGTEGTTWAAPVAVTIPANATNAVLHVVPLMDGDVTSDVTITVALASGNYELPASNAATLTLVNLAAPPGKKTWVATANGNASDGANWSPSGAPTATDEILFDGNFSNANCTWDVATLPRVASFTQTADYNGAVVFDIAYPTDTSTPSGNGAFEVTGSAELLGGKWTQVACGGYSDTKRLAIKIGGDLTVAAGASIDVTLKGSKGGHARAGCYGGDNGEFGKVYGDPKYPFWCGSGNGADNSLAGGAVWLEVAGDVTLNGDIISNGTSGSSGGSVYLKAASLLGSGHIYANGNGWSSKGSGGRIAVELTNSPLPATLTVPGNFQAYGSYGGSVGPAPGTIVIKEPGQANGDLYVSNGGGNFARWNPPRFGASVNELTTIPANAVWTFDHVYIGGYGTLCVGEGATLNLPNGFVSLGDGGMSGVRRMSSLMLLGGTLNVPAVDGVHTFDNGAFFYPATHYAFAAGGVVVKSGASIGASYLKSARDEHVCDFAVTGDLTVEAGGYVDVSLGGFGGQNENYTYTQAGCHGGQSAEKSGNQAYGSVFAPSLGGGTNGGNQDAPQIGAASLKVSVSGTLTVNGTVTASAFENPKFGTASGNAGGSIDITAATLAGTGIIAADGSEGFKADDNLRYNLGRGTSRGGGGRIAIRLTDGDFSSFDDTKITATGWYSNHNVAGDFDKTPLASSAGTVYLQPSGVGEKCGTVYIRNTGTVESSNWTHSLTWLPAGTRGDAVSDFRYADLVLDGAAWVALSASFRAKSVALASNCAIDLNGETLVVERATLGGVKLSPGTYAAGNAAVVGFVVDSTTGGSLVVTGGGFTLIVR